MDIVFALGENNYEITKIFLQSFFGKFIVVSLCWTFSFHILNEIRHFIWDMGYGFDIKTAKNHWHYSFLRVLHFNNFILFNRKKFFSMHTSTKKWLFIKFSSLVLIPLMIWFIINLVSISDLDYLEIVNFFTNQPSKILFSLFLLFFLTFFQL